jgi:DNA-binding XRE family transcriptional regulator
MAASILDSELRKSAARDFAYLMRSFMECSSDMQQAILSMARIVTNPDADQEDREMALATMQEALFPSSQDGRLGIDLEELEDEERGRESASVAELDAQEANFASRVQELLTAQGLTQAELAVRAGVGQPAISMMLSRQCRPQARTVARIARALDVTIDQLWTP